MFDLGPKDVGKIGEKIASIFIDVLILFIELPEKRHVVDLDNDEM